MPVQCATAYDVMLPGPKRAYAMGCVVSLSMSLRTRAHPGTQVLTKQAPVFAAPFTDVDLTEPLAEAPRTAAAHMRRRQHPGSRCDTCRPAANTPHVRP